jgi:hypothetical protein
MTRLPWNMAAAMMRNTDGGGTSTSASCGTALSARMRTPRTRVKVNSTWSPKPLATLSSSDTLVKAAKVSSDPTGKPLLWSLNFCRSSALCAIFRPLPASA